MLKLKIFEKFVISEVVVAMEFYSLLRKVDDHRKFVNG